MIARVRQGSLSDYQRVVQSSLEAYQIWSKVPAPKRGEIVRQIGNEFRLFLQPLGKLVRLFLFPLKRSLLFSSILRSPWKWERFFLKGWEKSKNTSISVIMPSDSLECSKEISFLLNVSQLNFSFPTEDIFFFFFFFFFFFC